MTPNNLIVNNEFLFKEISKFIIKSSNFKEIFEFSLLSKSIFKIIQKQINNNDLMVFTLGSLLKYFEFEKEKRNDKNLEFNDEFRLIQFNKIQYITINRDHINQPKINILFIKLFLQKVCSNLKRIRIINKYLKDLSYIGDINQTNGNDDEEELDEEGNQVVDGDNHVVQIQEYQENKQLIDGLLKFERVVLLWENLLFPCSSQNEVNDLVALNGDNNLISHYPFSFQSLFSLEPIKVYITTTRTIGRQYYLFNLDYLLNEQSISTIKFHRNPTTPSFIKNALSRKHVKSLSVKLYPNYKLYQYNRQYNEQYDDNEEGYQIYPAQPYVETIDNDNIDDNDTTTTTLDNSTTTLIYDHSKFAYEIFKSAELDKNSSLNRLKVKFFYDYQSGVSCANEISSFFNLLENNKSLNTLGIEYFNITNENQLEPLFNLKNIKTLYCNSNSLNSVFKHLSNSNSNIEKLKYKYSFRDGGKDKLNDQDIILYSNLFKSSGSLKSITIGGLNSRLVYQQILDLAKSFNSNLIIKKKIQSKVNTLAY